MTGPKRAKMSAVDTAWLRMDRPGNLMMISGVLVFGRPRPLRARASGSFASASCAFRVSGSGPSQLPGVAYWENVPDFSIDEHVLSLSLPGRAATRELQALVSRLASRPLDPARPLWQFHLVDNFAGGSALIARIHHCYADGIALVRVMMSMTDAAPNGPPAMPFRAAPARSRRKAPKIRSRSCCSRSPA